MQHREDQMHTLVNLTPHDIVVYDREGKTVVRRYERSGYVCSVTEVDAFAETGGSARVIDGIQVLRPAIQTGLSHVPNNHRPDVIVSQITAQYIVSHWDKYANNFGRVFVPGTSPVLSVRDDKGQITGTKALIEYQARPPVQSFMRADDPLFQGIFRDPAVRQQFQLDK